MPDVKGNAKILVFAFVTRGKAKVRVCSGLSWYEARGWWRLDQWQGDLTDTNRWRAMSRRHAVWFHDNPEGRHSFGNSPEPSPLDQVLGDEPAWTDSGTAEDVMRRTRETLAENDRRWEADEDTDGDDELQYCWVGRTAMDDDDPGYVEEGSPDYFEMTGFGFHGLLPSRRIGWGQNLGLKSTCHLLVGRPYMYSPLNPVQFQERNGEEGTAIVFQGPRHQNAMPSPLFMVLVPPGQQFDPVQVQSGGITLSVRVGKKPKTIEWTVSGGSSAGEWDSITTASFVEPEFLEHRPEPLVTDPVVGAEEQCGLAQPRCSSVPIHDGYSTRQ